MTKNDGSIDALVRIEVTDEAVIPGRSGIKDGKPWTIPVKHPCWLWQGDRYPTRIELPVPDAGRPRPGFYFIAGTPFKTGVKDGRIFMQFDERAIELVACEEVGAFLTSKPPLKAAS